MFGFVYIFTSRSGLLSWVKNKTEFFTETKNFKQLNRWFTLSVQQVIISYYDYILNIKLLTFVAYLRHGYILYARGMCVDLFHRWSYLQPCVRCGCPEWHRGVNGSRDVTCHDIWSHWPIFCTPVAFNEHFNLTKPLYWLYHFIFQIRSSSSFPFLKDIWLSNYVHCRAVQRLFMVRWALQRNWRMVWLLFWSSDTTLGTNFLHK